MGRLRKDELDAKVVRQWEQNGIAWQNVDVLSLRAYHDKAGKLIGSKNWAGSQPRLTSLRWLTES